MKDSPVTKAAFFDVDGTLTSGRTWMGFLEYFRQNGLRRATRVAYFGYHYPLYFLKKLGLISEGRFRAPWAANMAWYVRGYTLEEASPAWQFTIDYLEDFWRVDSISILNEHTKKGDLVALVSSAPEPLLGQVARKLGVEHFIGTRLEIKDGRFTGRSLKPTCIDSFKASMTREYLADGGYEIDFETSYSYADSIADFYLLDMTGNPTAVYPDEALRNKAIEKGWRIYPEPTADN